MNRARMCCGLTLCLLLAGGLTAQAAVVHLTFDGTTTGGWTTTTVFPLGDPTTDPIAISAAAPGNPTGANGIYYDDSSDGLQHYVAPASLLSMDLTGMQLQFGFYIPKIPNLDPVTPAEFDQITIADGDSVVFIDNLIDVNAVDTLQNVTIDFAALPTIDASNLTLLTIQADYYEGAQGIESYLVPEPVSQSLFAMGLFGLACFRRRRVSR